MAVRGEGRCNMSARPLEENGSGLVGRVWEATRVVESESREVGKSLKIGKNRIKSEKSDLISY